jgi:hypothetical protein
MATATTPLAEQAESIFTNLGYSVSNDGPELRAERKWRVVHVRVGEDPAGETDAELQCFVTWDDRAGEVYDTLVTRDPEYEWAVLGISEDGEYECYRQRGTAPN